MATVEPFPTFVYPDRPSLVARPDCPWADTMVLNPAIISDPAGGRLHMLFRATGPGAEHRQPGRPLPYPIVLGYATSDDEGATWTADFSRPALAPALKYRPDEIRVRDVYGRETVDYANGCIEDPRLIWLDGECLLSVACRMFPPGPYWEHDDPVQCCPDWITAPDQPLGRAARENLTVTVLYRVDLDRLKERDYDHAFAYMTPLTDPALGDNRDAFLFPERLMIGGKKQYVLIHRPREARHFTTRQVSPVPSIFLAAAENLVDLPTSRAVHQLLAEPLFEWEGNRIGGSWPPIRISDREWLFAYHGKKDDTIGYTQSFMILRQRDNDFPEVAHRCSERLMFAERPWEFSERFTIPCLFSCGGVLFGDTLLIGYGAGDEKVGVARVNFRDLVNYVRQFDAQGRRIDL